MDSSTFSIINQHFDRIIDLPTAEQEAALQGIVEKDIQQEVRSLLEISDKDNDFLNGSCALFDLDTLHLRLTEPTVLPPVIPSGTLLGDFEVIRALGAGATARVFLALQVSLKRQVAIKVAASNTNEHLNIAKLRHENIIPVYSVDTNISFKDQQLHVICMQFIEGPTLNTLITLFDQCDVKSMESFLLAIKGGYASSGAFIDISNLRTSISNINDLFLYIADGLSNGLSHAHENDILHLDIKPSNIMFYGHLRPMLVDFNVALSSANASAGNMIGASANFMSPEQEAFFSGARSPLTCSSDVFSLGKTLLKLAESMGVIELYKGALDRSLQVLPSCRHETVLALNEELRALAKIRSFQVSHPTPKFGLKIDHPLWLLLMMVPQILGSIFNISYNYRHIISDMSPGQKTKFIELTEHYNLFLYPVLLAIAAYYLYQIITEHKQTSSGTQQDRRDARAKIIRWPFIVLGLSTIGWVPGAFIFPYVLESNIRDGYSHFIVSFLVSWLLVSTYSILVGFHVAVRGLYTAHWRNEIEYSEIASQELAAVRRWTANARWVAIFLPVLACSLYLNMGEDFISDVSFTVMRVSLWFFVALGGFSAWLSISCGGSILKYVEEISSDVDSRFN